MTTEQIDNYLSYILAVEEAYKRERGEAFLYSEDNNDSEESEDE